MGEQRSSPPTLPATGGKPVERGTQQAFDQLGRDPAAVQAILGSGPLSDWEYLYLDEQWHGIHWLLTGSTWGGEFPGGFLLVGGRRFTDELREYQLRGFRSGETARIAEFVRGFSRETLLQRFDPSAMNAQAVLPEEVWEDPDAFDLLMERFDSMQRFLVAASEASEALLVIGP